MTPPRAERDYSGRSLFEKLGIFAGAEVALAGRHEEGFVDAPRDLARFAQAASHLKSAGALWVFHPKGRGAAPTDAQVRAAGLAAGLVDNKISAYTDSHTATRFVIPRSKR